MGVGVGMGVGVDILCIFSFFKSLKIFESVERFFKDKITDKMGDFEKSFKFSRKSAIISIFFYTKKNLYFRSV